MKKLVAVVLSLLLLFSFASAEVDLSSMSYEELVALKDKINLAMWNSHEWQEVTVPIGIWKIGEDIPAGHWTIKCSKNDDLSMVTVGTQISEDGKSIAIPMDEEINFYHMEVISGEEAYGDQKAWDYDFKDGMYLSVNNCNVIFTPYAGKPSLDFR